MSQLMRHVPGLALDWAQQYPDQNFRQIDGTLCFADISGFTALAERLAQRGRMGGEELVETLGRVFSEMLDIARQRRGTLLKFGGDALLLFFEGSDHALQAASAAVDMRAALRRAAQLPTSVGPLRLSMSVGLHSGLVDFFLVGSRHRELVLLGPAADAIVVAEHAAQAREIVVTAATAALLPRDATRARNDGQLLLRWRKPPVPSEVVNTQPDWPAGLAAELFPAALGRHLAAGPPDPEHRVACIAFIRFSGTDRLLADGGPAVLAGALERTVGTVQEILDEEGVTLLAVDLDRDGGKFFLASGIPRSHEDDEGVMLRALRRIMDANLPLPLQAGVSRGHVFAVEVGTSHRAAFSAMGDTTNTAARIAAQTPPGSIFVHPEVLDECLIRFEVEQAGPLTMKGKALPQVVYSIGAEVGIRQREGLDIDEFVGRERQLQELSAAIDSLTDGHGRVVSVVGEPGMGRTRLLREALRDTDATVLWMRGEPYGANSPYRVWRDTVRTLLGVQRGSVAEMAQTLARNAAARGAELTPWLTLLGAVAHIEVPESDEVRALEAEFRPARTAELIVDLIDAVHPGPVVLAIDDAHWSDDASAQLLSHLERAVGDKPWLLLISRRRATGGFVPESGVVLELEPLAKEEVQRIVLLATEAAPLRPRVVDTIVERAAGFPLFAIEIIKAVRTLGSPDVIPESLEAAMAAQVGSLDPDARRALRYASILGRTFARSLLFELLARDGHTGTDDTLARLEAFIEPEGEAYFRFRNGVIHDTSYESVSFRVRRRLHQIVGETLEQQAEDPDMVANALSLHFSRAADYSRTWRYARVAAEAAARNYANIDAGQFFEMALDAARHLGNIAAREKVQVWRSLGVARELSGEFESSLDAYARAVTLLEDDGVAHADLLLQRAKVKLRVRPFSAALRDLTVAAKQLQRAAASPEAAATLAKIESFRASTLFRADRLVDALMTAQAAERTARSAGSRVALAEALMVLGLATFSLEATSGARYFREALKIYEELGDKRMQAVIRSNIGAIGLVLGGNWNEAIEHLRGAADLSESIGDSMGAADTVINLGEALVKKGEFKEAERLLQHALRDVKTAGYVDGVADIELQLAQIMMARGQHAEAERVLQGTESAYEELGMHQRALEAAVGRAQALNALGDPDGALAHLERAEARAGAEALTLRPMLAVQRAAALTAQGRFGAARREIEHGLESAVAQQQPYDEAMLRYAKADLDRQATGSSDPEDLRTAERLLGMLGIAAREPAA